MWGLLFFSLSFSKGSLRDFLLVMPSGRYAIRQRVADILNLEKERDYVSVCPRILGRTPGTPRTFAHHVSQLSITMTKCPRQSVVRRNGFLQLIASEVSVPVCLVLLPRVCGVAVHCGGRCVVEEPIHFRERKGSGLQ